MLWLPARHGGIDQLGDHHVVRLVRAEAIEQPLPIVAAREHAPLVEHVLAGERVFPERCPVHCIVTVAGEQFIDKRRPFGSGRFAGQETIRFLQRGNDAEQVERHPAQKRGVVAEADLGRLGKRAPLGGNEPIDRMLDRSADLGRRGRRRKLADSNFARAR